MSKQLKQYESTKLFYSEYLYKLVFRNQHNVIFRGELQKKEKLSFARSQLDTLTEQYRNNLPLYKKAWRTDVSVDVNDYFDIAVKHNVTRKEITKDDFTPEQTEFIKRAYASDYAFYEKFGVKRGKSKGK